MHFSRKKNSSTFPFTRQFNFTVSQNIRSFNMNKSKKDIFDQGRDLLTSKISKVEQDGNFLQVVPMQVFLVHVHNQ